MGTFKSSKIINGSPTLIPQVGRDVMNYFIAEGYDVQGDSLISGGYDISVSKGNIFKALSGMKTALKILIRPQSGQIYVEAGVGIFGQQAIPTLISITIFTPLLLFQIWGIIQQSNLDEKAIEIAESSIYKHSHRSGDSTITQTQNSIFCTNCGKSNLASAKYCGECGFKF